jgi:hypothetical protein
MRLLGSLWDWAARLLPVWTYIGASVLAVIYVVWAYLQHIPLPYLVPLGLAMLFLLLGVIFFCTAIYDRFRRQSPLQVFVDTQNWEVDENPNEYALDALKYGQFFKVEVANNGENTIEGIRVVYWYDGETRHHAAYGTDKSRLTLDPKSRKLVKLFFHPYRDYAGKNESADPRPLQITVRATAKDTMASRDLRLDYQPTGAEEGDYKPIYDVSIRE